MRINTYHYEQYKKRHDEIKPIRGRSTDVRPIGARRRDWERFEMDGDVVCIRLYHTQVVRYYPDGRVGVQCGGWVTPTTAAFIQKHSPFVCCKRFNKLWVYADKCYPLPDNGEIIFSRGALPGWALDPSTGGLSIIKTVIDKGAMQEARAVTKPFLDWAKLFLKLSDGWLMGETREQTVRTLEQFELALKGDSDAFLNALFYALQYNYYDVGENRTDIRYKFSTLRGVVDNYIKTHNPVFKQIAAGVQDRPVDSICCKIGEVK